MTRYRDGWNDPPPTSTPLDHEPTANTYVRRGLKRGLIAAATIAVTCLTYALLPIAFAVGGAVLGLWWIAAGVYDWLDGHTVDEEPMRS